MLEWLNKYIQDYSGEYAWVVYIFLVVFATLLIDFIVKGLLKIIQAKLSSTKTLWDDVLVDAIRSPLGFIFGSWVQRLFLKYLRSKPSLFFVKLG